MSFTFAVGRWPVPVNLGLNHGRHVVERVSGDNGPAEAPSLVSRLASILQLAHEGLGWDTARDTYIRRVPYVFVPGLV